MDIWVAQSQKSHRLVALGRQDTHYAADYFGKLANLIEIWHSRAPQFAFETSGTTGAPKKVFFSRRQVEISAQATINFFGLSSKNVFVSTLGLNTVGGAMQVLRALWLQAPLVCLPPSAQPIYQATKQLANGVLAVVPYQLSRLLLLPTGKAFLKKQHQILIGGGPLDAPLEATLLQMGLNAWHTYGMTETLSHVAVRPLGQSHYQAIDPHKVKVTANGQLQITTPLLGSQPLLTNDLAKTISPKGSFELLGRTDDIINTGGKKVNPAEVEALLASHIGGAFCVSWVPSATWGQAVVLVLEQGCAPTNLLPNSPVFLGLPTHMRPKHIVKLPTLPRNPNGKILRKEVQKKIANFLVN